MRVLDGNDMARFAPSSRDRGGHLLFRRQTVLMAQPFDPVAMKTTGAPTPIVEGVGEQGNTGFGAFAISNTGVLLHAPEGPVQRDLVWRDRGGRRQTVVATLPSVSSGFALAPDGRQIAFTARNNTDREDIVLQGLPQGVPAPLTFGSGIGWNFPAWLANGSELAFATSDRAGLASYEIRRKPIRTGVYVWDWSPDGTLVMYSTLHADEDLMLVPAAGGKPTPFAMGPGSQSLGQFSPDGRWIAYTSNEAGEPQIYVRPFRDGDSVWQISTAGGTQPRWRPDGKELFFRANDGKLISVPVLPSTSSPTNPTFEHGPLQVLFDGLPGSLSNLNRFSYQPATDGQRFLIAEPVAGVVPPINVVLNWQAALGK